MEYCITYGAERSAPTVVHRLVPYEPTIVQQCEFPVRMTGEKFVPPTQVEALDEEN